MAGACRDQHWLNREHLAVCRIPAPTFQEGDRAAYLRGRFREHGHKATIDRAGNVVVPIVHTARRPFVAVTAHMDTILSPGRPEDVRIASGGLLRGPGVTDNGTGLTAIVALSRMLAEPLVEDPQRNTVLVANVAEEGEGNLHGIRFLAEHSAYRRKIDRYLVVDGASLGHITAAALGSRRFDLVIRGHGGHSWSDFGRANPIHALCRAVSLMSAAELSEQPKVSLSVGVVHGGTSVNSIPSRARAKIDVRSEDESAIEKTARMVRDAARAAVAVENRRSTDSLQGFELRDIGFRPAAKPLAMNPVADCFQAVDSHLGIHSALDCASTDANIPLAAGVPTVAVGAGGRGGETHAPGEWYDPRGRELGLRRIVLALACLQQSP